MDLVRTTHFNRTRDMLGEDPFLASELSVTLSKAIQDEHAMTTQLQVVAALRYVTAGTYAQYIRETDPESVLVEKLEAMTAKVTAAGYIEFTDFCSRRLVESAALAVTCAILKSDALCAGGLLDKPLAVFGDYAASQLEANCSYIMSLDPERLAMYR